VLRAYVDGRQLQFAVSAVIKALFPELGPARRVYPSGQRVARDCDMESLMAEAPIASRSGLRWWHLLLLVPFVALLWVPLYNSVEPSLLGIPFFYASS
jgi:hypothetical protein